MQAQGKFEAAEELLRRALSIREDALGPDHPMVPPSSMSPCSRTLSADLHAHRWLTCTPLPSPVMRALWTAEGSGTLLAEGFLKLWNRMRTVGTREQ